MRVSRRSNLSSQPPRRSSKNNIRHAGERTALGRNQYASRIRKSRRLFPVGPVVIASPRILKKLYASLRAGDESFRAAPELAPSTIETRGVPSLFCGFCRKGSGFDVLPICLHAFVLGA